MVFRLYSLFGFQISFQKSLYETYCVDSLSNIQICCQFDSFISAILKWGLFMKRNELLDQSVIDWNRAGIWEESNIACIRVIVFFDPQGTHFDSHWLLKIHIDSKIFELWRYKRFYLTFVIIIFEKYFMSLCIFSKNSYKKLFFDFSQRVDALQLTENTVVFSRVAWFMEQLPTLFTFKGVMTILLYLPIT